MPKNTNRYTGTGTHKICEAKSKCTKKYKNRKKNLQKQNFLESKSDLLKYKIQAGAWPSLSLESSYLTVKGSEPRLTNFDDYDGDHPADW